MPSSRERVAKMIGPMLPTGWRKINAHTAATIPALAAPAVYIDYTSITHDGMPAGAMLDGFDIALISHLTDLAKAEDALDPAVRHFTRQLDDSQEIAWSGADKRMLGPDDKYLAWVVKVQLPVNLNQE